VNALVLLASDTAPPGFPAWVWGICCAVVAVVVMKIFPLAASQWVASQQKTAPKSNPPAPAHELAALAKWAVDHEAADAQRHADVKRWFEETRASNVHMEHSIQTSIRTLDSRLVRNETIVERELPPRDPTGSHQAQR
jgi:hypothetical protein